MLLRAVTSITQILAYYCVLPATHIAVIMSAHVAGDNREVLISASSHCTSVSTQTGPANTPNNRYISRKNIL